MFSQGMRVGAEIRMMNKTAAAWLQRSAQRGQVLFDDIPFDMNENIETEHEVD
jgi:hypothetical protein